MHVDMRGDTFHVRVLEVLEFGTQRTDFCAKQTLKRLLCVTSIIALVSSKVYIHFLLHMKAFSANYSHGKMEYHVALATGVHLWKHGSSSIMAGLRLEVVR